MLEDIETLEGVMGWVQRRISKLQSPRSKEGGALKKAPTKRMVEIVSERLLVDETEAAAQTAAADLMNLIDTITQSLGQSKFFSGHGWTKEQVAELREKISEEILKYEV